MTSSVPASLAALFTAALLAACGGGGGDTAAPVAAAPAPAPAPAPDPAPAPEPAPAPAAPPPAAGSYLDFAATAPATGGGNSTAATAAWLAGTYHGRTSAGSTCSVQIDSAGQFVGSMNGSTQTAALDGESNDRAVSVPVASFAFGVTAAGAGVGMTASGAGGRLTNLQMAGVLDLCALLFRSDTPMTIEPAATAPMPLKTSGLLASELPAALIGTRQGYAVGTIVAPRTVPVACTLTVAADGTVTLATADRTFIAQVDGGTGSAADASLSGRISGYQAISGANGLFYRVNALSLSGANDVAEVLVELAHTSAKSQVTYASAQVRPAAGGLGTNADACYFPN